MTFRDTPIGRKARHSIVRPFGPGSGCLFQWEPQSAFSSHHYRLPLTYEFLECLSRSRLHNPCGYNPCRIACCPPINRLTHRWDIRLQLNMALLTLCVASCRIVWPASTWDLHLKKTLAVASSIKIVICLNSPAQQGVNGIHRRVHSIIMQIIMLTPSSHCCRVCLPIRICVFHLLPSAARKSSGWPEFPPINTYRHHFRIYLWMAFGWADSPSQSLRAVNLIWFFFEKNPIVIIKITSQTLVALGIDFWAIQQSV